MQWFIESRKKQLENKAEPENQYLLCPPLFFNSLNSLSRSFQE